MNQIDLSTRNTDILTVLQQAAPMLRSLAFQFGLEYDEMYQMAAIAALENYEKAQASHNLHAFLYGVVRNVLWYKPKEEPTLSLDRHLDGENGATYADLLPAPSLSQADPEHIEKKTRALYASLRKLPLEAQLYLARVHELNAYRPVRPKKGRFAGKRPNYSRDSNALSRQAYHYLRHDRRLAHAICGTSLGRELDFTRDFTQWSE